MAESTCLVTIVSGELYERFADDLFRTAAEFFWPTESIGQFRLAGDTGWPEATITRPRILSQWLCSDAAADYEYVFLIDADARFEAGVGPEILPPGGRGITATLHPGYVGKPKSELPYERDPASVCGVFNGLGESYFCGGFIGGDRRLLAVFMAASAGLIATDKSMGHVPRWHDESAHNALLAESPPSRTLDPSYACPDDDSWYRRWWPEQYERRIVMLDKTAAERAGR